MRIKKSIIIMLAVLMVLSTGTLSFAETDSAISLGAVSNESGAVKETVIDETSGVLNVPVFFTQIEDTEDDALMQSIQNEISEMVKGQDLPVLRTTDTRTVSKLDLSESGLIEKGVKVYKVSDTLYETIANSYLYKSAFSRAQEYIDNGMKVNFINLYLTYNENSEELMSVEQHVNSLAYLSQESTNAKANYDSESYWENTCKKLDDVDGYKFLSIVKTMEVESNYVTVGNVSSTIKWPVLITKGVKNYIQKKSAGTISSLLTATDIISDLSSTVSDPLNVTYGKGGGYEKVSVAGDIYLYDILIQDKLDKIKGYAYYIWGHREKTKLQRLYKIRYPYKKISDTEYEYKTKTPTGATKTSCSWSTHKAFCRKVIEYYKTHTGYSTYNQYLDAYKLSAKLAS